MKKEKTRVKSKALLAGSKRPVGSDEVPNLNVHVVLLFTRSQSLGSFILCSHSKGFVSASWYYPAEGHWVCEVSDVRGTRVIIVD